MKGDQTRKSKTSFFAHSYPQEGLLDNIKRMKYFTDGWMKVKNPSPYGGGFTVINEDGDLIRYEDIKQPNFTNNDAEILGIVWTLEHCQMFDEISTDSMCCLSWINGGKSKARPDLNDMLLKGQTLMKEKNVNLMWEGRDFNLAGIYNEDKQKRK